MSTLLEHLFCQQDAKYQADKTIENRIKANAAMLKKDLNKWQKRQLLRIMDDTDNLAFHRAKDSFTQGMSFGVQLMLELSNKQDKEF